MFYNIGLLQIFFLFTISHYPLHYFNFNVGWFFNFLIWRTKYYWSWIIFGDIVYFVPSLSRKKSFEISLNSYTSMKGCNIFQISGSVKLHNNSNVDNLWRHHTSIKCMLAFQVKNSSIGTDFCFFVMISKVFLIVWWVKIYDMSFFPSSFRA